MKCAVEMCSGAMIYIPCFIKTVSGIQPLSALRIDLYLMASGESSPQVGNNCSESKAFLCLVNTSRL
jgi:hypothetical protein